MPKRFLYTTIAILFAFGLMFALSSCGKDAKEHGTKVGKGTGPGLKDASGGGDGKGHGTKAGKGFYAWTADSMEATRCRVSRALLGMPKRERLEERT